MKYRVHVFAVVRVPVEIEAESQAAALVQVDETFCLRDHLPLSGEVTGIGDAEQVTGFIVDEVGDSDYERSRNYDAEGKPV